MASVRKIHNMDDMIEFMGEALDRLGEQVEEYGLNQKLAEFLLDAEASQDEDALYKAELMQGFVNRIVNTKLQLAYLRMPVCREGKLSIGMNQKAFLGGMGIECGTPVEYLDNGKWNYGTLHFDRDSGNYEIWTWDARVAVKNAEGLHVRTRCKKKEP